MNSNINILYNLFSTSGYDLYMVGGCVRDFILKKEIKDIDLVTNASPEDIIKILDGYKLDLTGKQFAVIRVYLEDGPEEGYEIATYRKDITEGRNPQIIYKNITINEDSKRRDLTINSLYMHPITNEILDFNNGLAHLKNIPIIISTPGNPFDRFNEDPLRILRTIRFKNRYIAKYAKEVKLSLSNIIDFSTCIDGTKEYLSRERITEEFIKGLSQSKNKKVYLNELHKFNFLNQILLFDEYDLKLLNYSDIFSIIASLFIKYNLLNLEFHLIDKLRISFN